MFVRRSAAVIALVAALAWPRTARAFCRTPTDPACSTCDAACRGLFWGGDCVSYSLNQRGSDDLLFSTLRDTIRLSFDHWQGIVCPTDGLPTYLRFLDTDPASCETVAFRPEQGNVNLITWVESGWADDPYHAAAAIALTTVFYDPPTGRIYTANTEFNGERFTFTVSDTFVLADVENTMTHEAGHFLGLGHSRASLATMFSASTLGETSKRTLDVDDIGGICDIYPAAFATGVCDGAPHGGLDLACGPKTGCGCAAAPASVPGTGLLLLLSVVGLFLAGRRLR